MYPDSGTDIVALLMARHSRIKDLLDRLRAGDGQRAALFDELVRTFAAHEYSEHQVAHPAARELGVPDDVVDQLMAEENRLEQALSDLCARGLDDPTFEVDLGEFAGAVIVHCAQEEQQEYTTMVTAPPQRLRELGAALLEAEAAAPTRPHPVARRSGFARLFVAPVFAILDRARDGMRGRRREVI
ncbi:hemerythrin domain-containing protein [Nocardia pseudobrasiliensis]|uniref:Hemerythrin HHE cation binding domain-containing protein n=1 Tax=Nocardia pseudobrasiliensis TaxID=45979 RepID=A0A370IAP9_9NOCA|nr:hemerythrin domain-containing protein [Nocardia pseudobrasiliensis]RDI67783.1 hemerythrin HHE cation binding domain-containing protein [Nocardia pseudobrasiliensis]